jgi:hypothetical protein
MRFKTASDWSSDVCSSDLFTIEIENLKRKNSEMLDEIIERDCLINHLK